MCENPNDVEVAVRRAGKAGQEARVREGGTQRGKAGRKRARPKTPKIISRSQARVENTEPGDVRGEIGVEMVDELGEPEARPESGTGTTFGSQAAIGTRISAPEKRATEQACGEQRLEGVHACRRKDVDGVPGVWGVWGHEQHGAEPCTDLREAFGIKPTSKHTSERGPGC